MKKLGFIEMECLSLSEIAEFESELTTKGCLFVSYRSMMNDNFTSLYSVYGLLEVDDMDFIEPTSSHGCNALKDAYEMIYGK